MMCACADALAAGRACVLVGAGLLAAVAEQASVHRSAAHRRAKVRGSVMSFGAGVAEALLALSMGLLSMIRKWRVVVRAYGIPSSRRTTASAPRTGARLLTGVPRSRRMADACGHRVCGP